jgi:AmmeMemoRadiSam system protein A
MAGKSLTKEERELLLELARKTILEHLDRGKYENVPASTESLKQPCGAFVSLHKLGTLRGCIGTFTSQRPLVNTIQEMAISASQNDPRFPPVKAGEMKDVDLEISVLSPLREIKDVSEIEVGRHGIFITRGFHSGVLLPQVATEHGWDRETFLEHTCLKAGLPTKAWKQNGTKIEIFDAQVFKEKDREGHI